MSSSSMSGPREKVDSARTTARWRLVAVASIVVVAAGLLIGRHSVESSTAGDPPTDASASVDSQRPTYDQQRRDELSVVLDRWAQSLRDGDVDALAGLMDERADPAFVDAQRARAPVVATVPFSEFRFEIGDDPETPVPSSVAESLEASDVWAPPVYLRYAIEGPDAEATRRPVSLLVARRDGRWALVDDRELAQYDRRTWRGPWDFGPLTVESVPTANTRSVVLGHPEESWFVSRLAAELPSAVDAVTDFWGSDWAQSTLVFVTSSGEEFGASTGSEATEDIAAVTVSDAVAGDGTPATGQRIVFGPQASNRLTELTTRSVLRHELTHVAARARTVDGSPLWALEGFADYSGYRGSGAVFTRIAPTLTRAVANAGPPLVLPRDEDFAAGGVRASLAYESAWSVFAFVADRFGESTLRGFYEQLATGTQTDTSIDAVLERTYGVSRQQFLAQWGAWVVANST